MFSGRAPDRLRWEFDILESLSLKNRFNRDVTWNVLSLGILGVSGMLTNTLILACQGPGALGIFNQVFAFFIVASQVSVGGLQFSVLKYCSHEQEHIERCSVIVSSALLLVSGLGLIISLSFILMNDVIGRTWSPEVAKGIMFAIPGLFFFSLNKVMIMALNGLRFMRVFATFQASRYLLILAGVIVIIKIGYTGEYLPISLTFAEIFLFLSMTLYMNIKVFPIKFNTSSEMCGWIKKHLSFGCRGFLSGTFIELNTRIDVLLLGYYMSDISVGIYSFASTFSEGFAQLSNVIRQNIDPVVGKAFSDNNLKKIKEISVSIKKTFYPIMIFLGVVLVAGFPIVIHIVGSGKDIWQSWGVFAILVAGVVIPCGYRPFLAILLMGGRPGTFTLLIAFSVISNIILNVIMIPFLGIFGSAVATMMVYILEAFAVVYFSKKLFGIRI